MPKLKKKVLNLLLILIIGGLGGILADQFLLPYLATITPFSEIGFIHQAGNGTTIIHPTERIIVTENEALEKAIDKISPCLVVIQAYQNESLLSQGTGFIMTSDGLIITAADLLPSRANQYLVFQNGQSLTGQLVKKDLENNLALLKIEKTNLPVVSLVNLEELRLGQRIVIIGLKYHQDEFLPFVNLGVIRSINHQLLEVNLDEENSLANGGPLINVKGQVVGLNLVDYKGLLKTIPANRIKEFIGL